MSESTESGRIVEVSVVPLGDVLAADHAAAETTLTLVSAVDFSGDGGTLTFISPVDDVTVVTMQFVSADHAASTITLAAGLPVALPRDTFLQLFPESFEKVALVVVNDEDEPIRALVPQGLYDRIPEGVRIPDAQEAVTLTKRSGGEWVIDGVWGAVPELDGTLVAVRDGVLPIYDADGVLRTIIGVQEDGSFTVIDVNGPQPQTPAAPAVASDPGLLIVSSYGLAFDGSDWPVDFRRFDVHVGTTPGFTMTTATRVGEWGIEGGVLTLAVDAGTYYAKLVAVNTSGAKSNVSGEVSQVVTAPSVGADGVTIYYTASPPAGLGIGDEAQWHDTDNGNKLYRWDGDTWEPVLLGPEATLPEILAGKRVPIDNAMSLDWAVPNPSEVLSTADELRIGWERIGDTLGLGVGSVSASEMILSGGVWYMAEQTSEAGYVSVYVLGSDGSSRLVAVMTDGGTLDNRVGLTLIGTTWHVMTSEFLGAGQYRVTVRRFDSAWALLGSWSVTSTSKGEGLTTFGTNLLLVRRNPAGSPAWYVAEQRNPTTGAVVSSFNIDPSVFGAYLPRAFLRGNFDFGATRIAVLADTGSLSKVFTFDGTTGATVATHFDVKARGDAGSSGFGWDGTRWVVNTQYGIRRGSTNATAGTVWVSYAYHDSVGGVLETASSPVSTISVAVTARHGLLITGALPPDVDENPAPNTSRIYAATAATQPTLSTLRRVTALPTIGRGGEAFVALPFALGAQAPPTVSTFPQGASGALEAELGGFRVDGRSVGDWPWLRVLVMEQVAAAYAPKVHSHPYAPASLIESLRRANPVGKVEMWYGAEADVPLGCLVLNGATYSSATYPDLFAHLGTTTLPDFRDRVPMGASGTKAQGSTGGANSRSLLAANLPPHPHGAGTLATGGSGEHRHGVPRKGNVGTGTGYAQGNNNSVANDDTGLGGDHTHAVTGSTDNGPGTSAPFDTTPAYRALHFIIRAAPVA